MRMEMRMMMKREKGRIGLDLILIVKEKGAFSTLCSAFFSGLRQVNTLHLNGGEQRPVKFLILIRVNFFKRRCFE